MRLVDDDQPVGVLIGGEMTARLRPRGELLVLRKLVERENLCRQPRGRDPLPPVLAQLRRADDERETALVEGVLLDEGEADLGLPCPDSVCIDDAVVTG